MAKITKAYMRTRDIDWFCCVNNKPAHFASFRGLLPKSVNDREFLMRIQQYVHELPDLPYPVIINHEFVNSKFGGVNEREDVITEYLAAFEKFARKGLMSFGKYDLANPNDNRYVLVAWSESPVEFRLNINLPLNMHAEGIEIEDMEVPHVVDISEYIGR